MVQAQFSGRKPPCIAAAGREARLSIRKSFHGSGESQKEVDRNLAPKAALPLPIAKALDGACIRLLLCGPMAELPGGLSPSLPLSVEFVSGVREIRYLGPRVIVLAFIEVEVLF